MMPSLALSCSARLVAYARSSVERLPQCMYIECIRARAGVFEQVRELATFRSKKEELRLKIRMKRERERTQNILAPVAASSLAACAEVAHCLAGEEGVAAVQACNAVERAVPSAGMAPQAATSAHVPPEAEVRRRSIHSRRRTEAPESVQRVLLDCHKTDRQRVGSGTVPR